jgi:hypothetical protein
LDKAAQGLGLEGVDLNHIQAQLREVEVKIQNAQKQLQERQGPAPVPDSMCQSSCGLTPSFLCHCLFDADLFLFFIAYFCQSYVGSCLTPRCTLCGITD